jgi:hypothetical protein
MNRTDYERDQVAEVFGLTGGELEDEPWIPTYVTDTYNEVRPVTFTYWYQGVPEYAEEDFTDWSWGGYRTVCRDEIFGQMPATVTDDEGTWRVVARYSSSGEIECPGRQFDNEVSPFPFPCPYCEATADDTDGHGYIYIGDGWAEIVYRLEDTAS